MTYIKVKRFQDFQHYKDRNPPWIKLYNSLLDDYEFATLPDEYKAHLMAIWLLASRMNNRIPNDASWISRKINATTGVNLQALLSTGFIEAVHDASESLQTAEQGACLETEERREEAEKKEGLPTVPESLSSSESLARWDEFCAWRKSELRKKVSATAARNIFKKFEGYAPEDFASALENSMANDWQGVFPPKTPSNGAGREKPKLSHAAICTRINAAINRRADSMEGEELQALYARHRDLLDSRDTAAAESMLRELGGE